jgi:hypothetical protein
LDPLCVYRWSSASSSDKAGRIPGAQLNRPPKRRRREAAADTSVMHCY